mgnify:CR=1 FL=1
MEVLNNMQEVKLEIRNLNKTIDQKTILNDISFEVYDGEFLSILGPSGCGKTTLLRILIGLDKATSGSILLRGKDISSEAPSDRKMGIVFQNYALFENMSVLENVEYALKIRKETKAGARERASEMLKTMGLEEHANKKPRALSGGQQQRVAIARTLVLNPEIILFDEPMSALDVETRIALRKELKDIQKQFGSTMIYITHDQEEAFALSDRIMVMEESKLVQLDTPENLMTNPCNEYIQSFVVDNLKAKFDSIKRFVEM